MFIIIAPLTQPRKWTALIVCVIYVHYYRTSNTATLMECTDCPCAICSIIAPLTRHRKWSALIVCVLYVHYYRTSNWPRKWSALIVRVLYVQLSHL